MASRFEAGGIVRASVTTLVASRVMAPVTAVHVRPGDRVRRGATLVTLDAREIDANRTRAAATSTSAAESVRAAEADLRSTESAVVLARATHDRIQGLFAKRSATAQEVDQTVAALSAAEAQAEAARARLSAATATRDAARAGADSARINATYSVLVAPFDGIVTERRVDPGALATPGAPLVTVEDASTFRLEVPIDEARSGFVAPGQQVEVRVDEPSAPAAAEWLRGRIAEIARLDPASHTFVVKIDLPSGACTRSGLFGRARFSGPARRALVVPRSAVIPRAQLSFVYLVDADSRARLRAISAGAEDGDRREVLAGVHEKDAVVAAPPPSLTDGVRVTGGGR
ncbi:MAG TPA: efflux RND transporter periplasmic adaptor subunit [Gemmatimonadaceae bacterium]|nr:efflux RND transporter periplasmic adaptor subunit [Gemmatimonadaceae bacterium]